MNVSTIKYADEKTGKPNGIEDITNEIQNINDVKDTLIECLKRAKDECEIRIVGPEVDMSRGKIEKFIVIDFRKGDKWKYLKLTLNDK